MSTSAYFITLVGMPFTLGVATKTRSMVLTAIPKECAIAFQAKARSEGYKIELPKLKHLEVRVRFGKEQKFRRQSEFEVFIKATPYNKEILLLSGVVEDIDFLETTF